MGILQIEPVRKDVLPLDHRHHGASRLYGRELIIIEIGRLEDMAIAVIHIPRSRGREFKITDKLVVQPHAQASVEHSVTSLRISYLT